MKIIPMLQQMGSSSNITFDSLSGLFNASGGGLAPTDAELYDAEVSVNGTINNVEYLIDNYFHGVLGHVVAADAQLADIDPALMRDTGGPAVINDALNQISIVFYYH